MAIGPERLITAYTALTSSTIEQRIDEELSKEKCTCGEEKGIFIVDLFLPLRVPPSVRKYLKKKYEDVGWGAIEFSEDNDEHKGLLTHIQLKCDI